MEMTDLYVAWRDPDNRRWFPVGRLSFDGEVYRFVYTKGALQSSGFLPFARMEDLAASYESRELFPLFANRLLSKKRPEYPDFLQWVDVPAGQDDPLTLLARTEGIRETDTLAVFPCPERGADNTYRVQFFSHGLRYLSAGSIERVHNLQPGERLFLMVDPQNPYDPWAVALRTGDPIALVGFCPRYFVQTFRVLLERRDVKVEVVVERVNLDAPTQLRLLCRLTAPWPEDFHPCAEEQYELLAQLEPPGALSLDRLEHRM
jgi:hypothetical protein